MPSHTRRRAGGIYYTRMVVPGRLRPIIGKSDLGRSLQTTDHREMMRLQPVWLSEALATIDAAEAEYVQGQTAPAMIANVADAINAMSRAEFDRWEKHQAEELQLASAEDDAEQLMAQPDGELAPADAAAARLLRAARRERDAYRGRYYARKRRDRATGDRHPEERRISPVTITGTFEGYASQPGSRQTTVKQFRAIINHLVAFLGHDNARRVSHRDIVRWRERLLSEPMKDGTPRSAKTINDSYVAAVKATFAYGRDRLLVDTNPAADVAKVRPDKSPKLREKDFTKVEREAILSAALKPASVNLTPQRALARRWVPWLCAYTGARVNEMTQLRASDVRQVDGVWTIRITPEAGDVKTNEARTVPIHEHLIQQGLLAALVRTGDEPLFYNPANARGGSDRGQYKKVGMFLANWVRSEVGITDRAVKPNHAWRHTFKSICLEMGIEERAADYIQGHASKGLGRRYGANTIAALAAQLAKFPRFNVSI